MEQTAGSTVRKVVSYGASFGGVAALAYAGEKGVDGGLIKDIWAAAKSASPFAAMLCLMLLFDQIKERREAQRQCNDRTIDYIKSVNLSNRALDKMADTVERVRGKKGGG